MKIQYFFSYEIIIFYGKYIKNILDIDGIGKKLLLDVLILLNLLLIKV